MKNVSAICLDIDNTLWNRDRSAAIVFKKWLSNTDSNQALDTILKRDSNGHSSRKKFFSWLSNTLDFKSPDSLWQEFQQELISSIKPNIELIRALTALDFPIYILSDGGSILQRKKLQQLGLTDLPKHIFISAETGFTKPDPEAFQQVITHSKLPANQILHCGDHPAKDIQGAKQTGMQTYRVTNTDTFPSFLATQICKIST